MKGHFTQAGNTALPTREGSVAALQDLQDKLATMRNREAQVDALHRLYNDPSRDGTYGTIAAAVFEHLPALIRTRLHSGRPRHGRWARQLPTSDGPPLRLLTPPSRRRAQKGHCSCFRCSGRRCPSRATNWAETQSIFLSRRRSQAPCSFGLCAFACFAWRRLRKGVDRCADPYWLQTVPPSKRPPVRT